MPVLDAGRRTSDAAAYACIGRMYVDDERFTATYDKIAVGLAAYCRDVIEVYARTRLSRFASVGERSRNRSPATLLRLRQPAFGPLLPGAPVTR